MRISKPSLINCFLVFLIIAVIESYAKIVIENTNVLNTTRTPEKAGLHDLFIKKIESAVEYFGFGIECKNGGYKTDENSCICKKYFTGNNCEKKTCVNGGKLEYLKTNRLENVCKCPKYITGDHCEKPTCTNNGKLVHFQNNKWLCDCSELYFYIGDHCEIMKISYTSIGFLAITFSAMLFLCLFIYCSRSDRASRNSRRMRLVASLPQENNLLQTADRNAAGIMRRTAAYPNGVVQPYVVRLDTIPTFNPRMIGGVDPQPTASNIPSGPPPSYDQALITPQVNPPEYTPTDTSK